MKILTLIIKQCFFDQIVSGEKKEETRELRPKSEKKYVVIDSDGAIIDIVHYDALRLYVGYNKGRASALVRVEGALIEIIEDEDGNQMTFTDGGQEHVMCNVVYQLGEILEITGQ